MSPDPEQQPRKSRKLCFNLWHAAHESGSKCPACGWFCARTPGTISEDDPHRVRIELSDGGGLSETIPNRGGLWLSRNPKSSQIEALELRFADGSRDSYNWSRVRSYSVERIIDRKEAHMEDEDTKATESTPAEQPAQGPEPGVPVTDAPAPDVPTSAEPPAETPAEAPPPDAPAQEPGPGTDAPAAADQAAAPAEHSYSKR